MKTFPVVAAAAVLSTAVFAQTATTATGTAPAEARYSTVSKDEMFSSKLKGLNITNQENSTVGAAADIAIRNDKLDAFILSVGGFLGMASATLRYRRIPCRSPTMPTTSG